jgi:hypothetical protein
MDEPKRSVIGDRDWVEVRVVQAAPVRYNGADHKTGSEIVMRYYEAKPAMKAGQVELVATRPDYDPNALPPEDLATDPKGGTAC